MSTIKPLVWRYTEEHFDSMGGTSWGFSPHRIECPVWTDWTPLYTADALAQAREEGRLAGLEEAAQKCDELTSDVRESAPQKAFFGVEPIVKRMKRCANAIRALKEKRDEN